MLGRHGVAGAAGKEDNVKILLVVSTPPYGSEGPYNALRLAEALLTRDEVVDVFLLGDAVHAARRGQQPSGGASVELQLLGALERGARVTLCGTCCASRGLGAEDAIDGVRIGTIHELAEAIVRADRVVSF
jgi:sulfur relay (sulfurtransferase) complex TusBCD TusD component (DsrE family)